jgi:Fic family protein
LEHNSAGLRKTPGTSLKNQLTGEIVYTPPQHPDEILNLMQNLVDFINDDDISDIDALIKMALIHHQFESIHPFYDGNGRTGRIINILYLVIKDLLNIPTLYLSRYIIENKNEYYRLLQFVRDTGSWDEWIIYILKGIEVTAIRNIGLVKDIKTLMLNYKQTIRKECPKIYSQDLLNNLFRHPYTKIEFLETELQISRLTAVKYLNLLTEKGLLYKQKVQNSNFYINKPLFDLFVK